MATKQNLQPLEFRAFHLFAGIGGGSLGAAQARASWMGVNGHIRNIGAIDVDRQACEDYRRFTGSPITCMDLFSREQYREFHGSEPPADWREATADDIRQAAGGFYPHIVFTSPPCKGFSGLLPTKSAESSKYQALNRLTIRSIQLIVDAFRQDLPAVILLENVPRIKTRGAHLLDEIKRVLKRAGYVVSDADHDCGEIGGLGQRRKRYLLIARHPQKCRPFIYQPPIRPLKTIGDVIGPLPLPDDQTMGPMHRLPRLKWLTWLRLALIPAGGDWRNLQKIAPEEYRITWEARSSVSITDPSVPENGDGHHSHFRVTDFRQSAPTVTGASHVANGAGCISDPRMTLQSDNFNGSPGLYGVIDWEGIAPAVTGSCKVTSSNCPAAIADPRMPESMSSRSNYMGVNGFDQPMQAVTANARITGSNCPAAIADPRLQADGPSFNHSHKLTGWNETAGTVTGGHGPSSGGICIGDVRINHAPRPGVYRILKMGETAGAVVGGQGVGVSNGPQAVADHRLGCTCRNGSYGVSEWDQPATAVLGSADCHSARAAIADARIPDPNDKLDPPPVIISLDGTWHRPLTTLELLALQSFPLRFADGSPVVLSGKSDSAWRERIGNAVPPEASRRMHEQIIVPLIQHALGETFVLASAETPIWVRKPLTEGAVS